MNKENISQRGKVKVIESKHNIDIITDYDKSFGIVCFGDHQQLNIANYPIKEAVANAHLFKEAMNTFLETNMTPNELKNALDGAVITIVRKAEEIEQLQQQRDELRKGLEKISQYAIKPEGETELQRIKRIKAIAEKRLHNLALNNTK